MQKTAKTYDWCARDYMERPRAKDRAAGHAVVKYVTWSVAGMPKIRRHPYPAESLQSGGGGERWSLRAVGRRPERGARTRLRPTVITAIILLVSLSLYYYIFGMRVRPSSSVFGSAFLNRIRIQYHRHFIASSRNEFATSKWNGGKKKNE